MKGFRREIGRVCLLILIRLFIVFLKLWFEFVIEGSDENLGWGGVGEGVRRVEKIRKKSKRL